MDSELSKSYINTKYMAELDFRGLNGQDGELVYQQLKDSIKVLSAKQPTNGLRGRDLKVKLHRIKHSMSSVKVVGHIDDIQFE